MKTYEARRANGTTFTLLAPSWNVAVLRAAEMDPTTVDVVLIGGS